MAGISNKLADRIKGLAFQAQVGKVHRLKGKYVRRDGIVFLVVNVDWQNGKIVASDVKTPVNQTTQFSIRSFFSKAVDELGAKPPEENVKSFNTFWMPLVKKNVGL